MVMAHAFHRKHGKFKPADAQIAPLEPIKASDVTPPGAGAGRDLVTIYPSTAA
jgi:hypothetical protein